MKEISIIDKKIMYLLHKNARLPNTTIAKKVKISKDTVKYRINRLLEKGIIKKFFLDIDHKALGYNLYTVFFRLQKVTKERKKNIINLLVKQPDVIFVAECSGNWDLWTEMLCNSIDTFDRVLSDLITGISNNLQDYKTLISISDYKRYSPMIEKYFEKVPYDEINDYSESSKIQKIDEIDYKILKLLEDNSRMTLIEISNTLNISLDIVRYRIKKLKNKGIIKGYDIVIDLPKNGYNLNVVIINLISLTKEKEDKLKNFLKFHPNIRFATKTTGKQEIILEILSKSNLEYQNVLNQIRNNFYDVIINYDQMMIFEDFKDVTIPQINFD